MTRVEVSLDQGETWTLGNMYVYMLQDRHLIDLVSKSEYPEDRFREVCHQDPFYGTLDASERDTSL